MHRSYVIHRAQWVFPVFRPAIEDGAVLVSDGHIGAVGRFQDLKDLHGGNVVDHGEGSILPALVNAHTHLELAAMRGRLSGQKGFVNWIRDLIQMREDITREQTKKAIAEELAIMSQRGVGLVGDIGNTEIAYDLCGQKDSEIIFFREFIGFSRDKTEKASRMLGEIGEPQVTDASFHLAAHAPYSVSARLLVALKAWASKNRKLLSIHLCECREEREFLIHGNGFLKELLRENSAWDDRFKPPGKDPVSYLDGLGVLDDKTICVHLVHLSEEEIATLATRRVRCCLCPRSNLFLQVGFPDVEKMLAHGLCLSLGTDSLASNDSLSILDEMATLAKYVPAISPEQMLEMATLNGARTLGQEDRLGSLAPGKEARMFFIPGHGGNGREVLEKIINSARTAPIHWIH